MLWIVNQKIRHGPGKNRTEDRKREVKMMAGYHFIVLVHKVDMRERVKAPSVYYIQSSLGFKARTEFYKVLRYTQEQILYTL